MVCYVLNELTTADQAVDLIEKLLLYNRANHRPSVRMTLISSSRGTRKPQITSQFSDSGFISFHFVLQGHVRCIVIMTHHYQALVTSNTALTTCAPNTPITFGPTFHACRLPSCVFIFDLQFYCLVLDFDAYAARKTS